MIRPDRQRSRSEVWGECFNGRDQRESFLFNRAVVPLGSSKLAAQVAYRMLYIVHNLEQNCTQTSLGSINCYRKWQVIIGWSEYWAGRQPRRQHWPLQTI